MLRLMVSAGMLAALAFSTASRKRGFADRSPPPWRAATMISRMTRVQTFPRFSSCRPLRCWIFAHLLCPATRFVLILRYCSFYFSSHGYTLADREERQNRMRAAARAGQPAWADHRRNGNRKDRQPANAGREFL